MPPQNYLVPTSTGLRLRHPGLDQEASSKCPGTPTSAGRLDPAEKAPVLFVPGGVWGGGAVLWAWGSLLLISANVLAGRARPGPGTRSLPARTKAARTRAAERALCTLNPHPHPAAGDQPALGRKTAGCPQPHPTDLGQWRASPSPASTEELCKLWFQKLFS